jgi:hypothetical protein
MIDVVLLSVLITLLILLVVVNSFCLFFIYRGLKEWSGLMIELHKSNMDVHDALTSNNTVIRSAIDVINDKVPSEKKIGFMQQ